MAGESAVPSLGELLKDKKIRPIIRYCSAWILGRINPEAKEAMDTLRKANKEDGPQMKSMYQKALKQISQEPNDYLSGSIKLIKVCPGPGSTF